MGEFLLELVERGRVVQRRTCANLLHFEGLGNLLHRAFPPLVPALAFTLGLTGATVRTRVERPNPALDELLFDDPRLTFWDLTNGSANEGGAPDDVTRGLIGYARQPVTFDITRAADSVLLATERVEFHNAVPWARQGFDDPPPPPWQAPGWEQWEPSVGFPYQIPNVAEDALGDRAIGRFFTANLHRLGGYPITHCFIATQYNQVVASSVVQAPLLWRPGGYVYAQYRGEIRPW